MRKKLGSIVISTALAMTLATGALAADPASMTDISGHWAWEHISWAMTENLMNGVSGSAFDPDGTMTRGMFVTSLGRLAGIDPEAYTNDYLSNLYADVDAGAYYAPYVNWATRYGIVNGKGGGFAPDEPITREDMAVILIRYASIYNYNLTSVGGGIAGSFQDSWSVSDYARDSVESLRSTGILNGTTNPDGTTSFRPRDTATRAEGATVLRRLSQSLMPCTDRVIVEPEFITLAEFSAGMKLGETMPMIASIAPSDATNQTLTWVSMNPSVARVDQNGTVTALAEGTAEIRGYTWNGLSASCTVTVTRNLGLASANQSFTDKCLFVFGRTYNDEYDVMKNTYASPEEAAEHMVTVKVNVWDFADSTQTTKITKTKYIQVNENIAETVKAIFDEIYNGDEQFPISDVGGYRWCAVTPSEHTVGLAIDINPDSNYYCDPDGTAITGSHWDPENDPYSIPLEGDVMDAFTKYGFTRGINWRSGYKDYMHFSFFGY